MTEVFRTAPGGLTAAQVRERVEQGRTNAQQVRSSRSYTEIARANLFTFFNGLLGTLAVLALLTGRWQNALFGGVVVANAAIGIVQEVRAKRTLDRLAVLNAPRARPVRDGRQVEVPLEDLVLDDLIVLRAGDQVPADGAVVTTSGLEVDESLLTGESEPVTKAPGDAVRSGSIVVAGEGTAQVSAVGAEAYAARLAQQARRFALTESELVASTNRLLRWISAIMVVVAPVLVWSQFRSTDNGTWHEAITGSVAALVGMVPEGLVLLTSLAFMAGSLTLARRSVLVQELPAVEVLARVDVVCLDKTGTLTEGDIRLDRVEPLGEYDAATVTQALALLARAAPANATTTAIAAATPAAAWRSTGGVPFSSARKWSATVTADDGVWVLGAPEIVLPAAGDSAQTQARAAARSLAATGARVVLLAHRPAAPPQWDELPPDLAPAALVVLTERLRPDARQTLAYFDSQGVRLLVLSGDNPGTVAAVAAAAGVPGITGPEDAVDARHLPTDLPTDLPALADVLERHSVFGRVTPEQKRAMVAALQSRGHVVAMTGDGVNDALALKDADIGVAMGSGSPATRAVAQVVLLDGRFAHLPEVVAEGRRVMANVERAAGLFLVKNAYSLLLALISAVTLAAYPLQPIQLTLVSSATIGVPGVLLALGPSRRRYVRGFLRRTVAFAVPAGVVIGTVTYAGYWFVRTTDPGAGVEGARTAAAITLLIAGWWVLLVSARPLTRWRLSVVVAVAVAIATALALPWLASGVFVMALTPYRVAVGAAAGVAAAFGVETAHQLGRAAAWLRRR